MVAAACLAAAGHRILGVDIDSERIAQLRSGATPFYEPGLHELVVSALCEERLRFKHPDSVTEPLGEITLIATGTPQVAGPR
jgi:UDPglucose 6-dehydrogenase